MLCYSNIIYYDYNCLWQTKTLFFDNFEWLNDQMPRWSKREDYGCCLQSYLNHLTSWHGPVQSVDRTWDVLVGEFSYQYRNNDDNDIVTRVSLETRLTKTDSSHVQEYVWLFAKQSINWQLCIGGVNSEIEITHSLLKWTKYLNAANVFQDTCSGTLKFSDISDHILWYFYLDVLGGQFKLHTNEEVHPISPLLEIIRIISQKLFI